MTLINSSPFNEKMNQVLELQRLIPSSLSGALQYMRTKFKSINSNGEKPLGGWSQFLEENASPSVTGTSCVITSMILCGESSNSSLFVPAKNFIISKQCPDGGWSKPSLEANLSLVLTTCQALRALLDANEYPTSGSIEFAVTWLIEAQNADGGWGYLSGDEKSDVTSTACAMKVLVRVLSFYPRAKDAIANGQKWLEEVKNQDGSWGRRAGQNGTLAHTSHAVEALLVIGNRASTLISTREWLEKNYRNCAQFQDLYKIQTPSFIERLSWSHMSNERCLIALLKLDATITSPEVIESVQAILDRQLNGTYWTNNLNTNPGASWAISESTDSLRLYANRLEHEAEIIILKTELSEWESTIKEYGKRIAVLEERLNSYSLKSIVKRLIASLRRPSIALGSLTFILLLVYLLLRLVLNLPSMVDIFISVLSIIGFVVTLMGVRSEKHNHDEQH